MRRRVLVLTILCIFGMNQSHSQATVWSIQPNGSGDAPTIQAGIDSSSSGDTLDLADGTFKGIGNRNIDFGGKEILVRSQSGDPAQCIIDCEGIWLSPPRGGFRFVSGEGPSAILEGVTITKARTRGESGGAIRITGASPTIRRCVFVDNRAQSGSGISVSNGSPQIEECTVLQNPGPGAGIRICCGGFPTIEDCTIRENAKGGISINSSTVEVLNCDIAAHSGGAGVSATYGALQMTGCTVSGNTSRGISLSQGQPTLLGCTIENNYASGNGGGLQSVGALLLAENCTFLNNESGADGGAVAIDGCPFSFGAVIRSCTFDENIAAGSGGALLLDGCGPDIDSCLFSGNTAGVDGGAIFLTSLTSVTQRLDQCVFVGNEATGTGGAMHTDGTLGSFFFSCTFYGNTAPIGSAYSVATGTATFDRTIVAFGNGSAIECDIGGSISAISCSDIFGNQGGDWVGCVSGMDTLFDNFSVDPEFCDTSTGDFTLRATSHCVNAPGCGLVGASSEICIPTGVASHEALLQDRPLGLAVGPNPFNPASTIRFHLAESGHVRVAAYDLRGRLVQVLVDGEYPVGVHEFEWRPDPGLTSVSSGILFIRLEAGDHTETRKVTLLR